MSPCKLTTRIPTCPAVLHIYETLVQTFCVHNSQALLVCDLGLEFLHMVYISLYAEEGFISDQSCKPVLSKESSEDNTVWKVYSLYAPILSYGCHAMIWKSAPHFRCSLYFLLPLSGKCPPLYEDPKMMCLFCVSHS